MDDRQLIADLLRALEYHIEQTRPIEFSKVAIVVAREYLRKPEQPAQQQKPEIEYCTDYHCAGDCGRPHNQKEMRGFLAEQPAPRVVDCHATGVCVQSGLRAEQPAPVQQILAAFPLLDDEGLDEEKHHCEWTLQQDRKRLHAMLAADPQPAQQEPVVRWDSDGWGDLLVDGLPDGTLLYTSPPAQRTWVGLTDEERQACINYRAVEAKLKEKNT